MKQYFLLFIFCIGSLRYGHSTQTNLVLDAGNLQFILAPDDLATITELTITGTMDARDFKVIRDKMPLLSLLDIEGVDIIAYYGSEGTHPDSWYRQYEDNCIPDYAFHGKKSLQSIALPKSLTLIGKLSFLSCGIHSIKIPDSVKIIDDWAFVNCSNLEHISFSASSSLVSINFGAFMGCLITNFNIPESVTKIGSEVFTNTKLKSIYIPKSVIEIESGAFSWNELVNIEVEPENDYYISDNGVLFNKDKTILLQYPAKKTDESYLMPFSVQIIANKSFSVSQNLRNIVFETPISLTEIKYGAFHGSGITSIEIPPSVTRIESAAFFQCYNLAHVTFSPTSELTFIGQEAFKHSEMTSIYIPAKVSTIESGALTNCINLASIAVDSQNSEYSDNDGILFSKDKTKLIQYPAGIKEIIYSIPQFVEIIGREAFLGSQSLRTIEIPSNIKSIENGAFYNCRNLTSLIVYPSIPINLEKKWSVFNEINKEKCILYVPDGSIDAYKNAYQWNEFTNIAPIVPISDIDINPKMLTLAKGTNQRITVQFQPIDATSKSLTWSSNDIDVITINKNGIAFANNEGTAIITAITNEGEYMAECTVTVVIPVSSVLVEKKNLTFSIGDSEQLIATVIPEEATNNQVSWSSSNTDIATVSSEGVVSAVGKGIVVITATTNDGNYRATCNVTVGQTTSVTDINKQPVQIFPNPVKTGNNYFVHIDDPRSAMVEVYDTKGTLISKTVKSNPNPATMTAPNNSGIYFVRITIKNNSSVYKLLVE